MHRFLWFGVLHVSNIGRGDVFFSEWKTIMVTGKDNAVENCLQSLPFKNGAFCTEK